MSFLIGNGPGEAENAASINELEGETVKVHLQHQHASTQISCMHAELFLHKFFHTGLYTKARQYCTLLNTKSCAIEQRRLLIGGVLTVALGAFALVPTDSLRIMKPTKPLFMYLIPLIRIQVPALRTDQKPSSHLAMAIADFCLLCGAISNTCFQTSAETFGTAEGPPACGEVLLEQNFAASLYVSDVVCSQALLTDVRDIVAEAKWDELGGALQRIQGTPNNAESNLRDAAYSEHYFCSLSFVHKSTCHNSSLLLEVKCSWPEFGEL